MIRPLFLSVVVLVLGCAGRANGPKLAPQDPPQVAPPYSLAIRDEVNDGSRIYVRAEITSHTQWDASDAALRLVGYRDGQIAGEEIVPLSSGGTVMQVGERREVPIVLAGSGITDYQLELLWGKENPVAMMKEIPLQAESGLVLQNLTIQSDRVGCDKTCSLKFNIAAELVNTSDKSISGAILGTGFVWTRSGALDLESSIPENEAEVELVELHLGPGASRKIRLALDQVVPERPDGAFRPVVRVKSYSH